MVLFSPDPDVNTFDKDRIGVTKKILVDHFSHSMIDLLWNV
jgi:hypothetical protein